MIKIRADKEKERSFTRVSRVTTRRNRVNKTSNSNRPVVVIQQPRQYGYFDTVARYAFLNSMFSAPARIVRETVIIKESGGTKKMTENEIRDSIKEQVGMVIDNVYEKIASAENLKPKSKYIFTITMTNPITKEVTSKELGLYGDEIMDINDFIRKNPVKSATIKRILKKEAWKIVHSMIKERL